MGFRFRKSLRLFKGLAVNVSNAGVGLRLGVPGLNVSVGPSGPALNVGIPGTGIGYRASLGRGRSAYREARAAASTLVRTQALVGAAQEHAAAEAVIARLAGVVSARIRAPLDFAEILRPRGPYIPRPFTAVAYEANEAWLRGRAAAAFPIWPWVLALILGAGGAVTILAGTGEVVGGLGLVVVTGGGLLGRQVMQRRSFLERLGTHTQATYEAEEEGRRRTHEADEHRRASQREQEEAFRARLRAAVAEDDPEPLADILEVELANEDWPVPVLADVDFEGLSEVTITVDLPELDDVPEERTSLTQRGKLSKKAMAKRDRVAIYEDLCCGVALRLAYEAFRVIPMLERVRVRGMATALGATGHDEDFVALALDLDRAALDAFDLDRVDPSSAVSALGKWGGNKKGELRPVA